MRPGTEADGAVRPSLHLQRIFDAPRDLVWLAWTRPEMAVRWLGPVEWPAVKVTGDLRVGGEWHATLKAADGDRLLEQGGVYREVDPPARLVFTFKWGDHHEDGEAVETLVTVELAELPDGRTSMTFTHEGLKSAESLSGHQHGWTSSFQRLDGWLTSDAKQERHK